MVGFDDFPDFSDDNLLESIDFDDLFVGMDDDDDRDMLPALEMDPELFSFSDGREEASSDNNNINNNNTNNNCVTSLSRVEEDFKSRKEDDVINKSPNQKKSSSKNSSQGKRKVKVDWTPDLHRRFVQAVEQLGVDKAVTLLAIFRSERLHNY
uniref:Transcription activator GLK1 n=1 Tax=Tanacetum cinerariifolium TaxID=118510 RepID=A0A6L2MPN7_TANCI|nr:transcription activator GLK1 [Tanacetum cinerariifolium]